MNLGLENTLSKQLNNINDSIIESYFKADDYLNYYPTLYVDNKRNISEEIIKHNYSLLLSLDDKEISNKIQNIIKTSNIGRINTNSYINDTAKKINTDGYNLLNIKDKLTKEYLNKCYRKASRKYHPDIGGSNEKMIIINNSVAQFRKIIKKHFLEEENINDFSMPIRILDDFKYAITEQLLLICTDIFYLDKAIEVYNYLEKNLLTKKKYYNYFYKNYNITSISNLAIRFYKSGNKTYTRAILRELKEICKETGKSGSRKAFDSMYNICRDKATGKEPARISIRHYTQAKYAHKFNIIDDEKYNTLIKKYQLKKEDLKSTEVKINQYSEKHIFLVNLGIYEPPQESQSKSLVPGLETFHDRFEYLTMYQKIEYVNMFKPPVSLEIINKYKKIRKNSYLLSLIQNYQKFKSAEVIRECNFLAELLNDKDYLLIIDAFDHLSSINSIERNRKLELLNEMDYSTDPKDMDDFSIEYSESKEEKGTMRISLANHYIEFMMVSVEKLIEFKNTAKDPFFYEEMAKDLKLIREIWNSELSKVYSESAYKTNISPNEMIDAVLPYITAQTELIPNLHKRSIKVLELDYTINLLTINYAKVQDWENVNKWIEVFFNLPVNHQNEFSKSKLDALKKRLIKANKKLEGK
jgi:hypothetical protein